jgi:ribosomal protein L9
MEFEIGDDQDSINIIHGSIANHTIIEQKKQNRTSKVQQRIVPLQKKRQNGLGQQPRRKSELRRNQTG